MTKSRKAEMQELKVNLLGRKAKIEETLLKIEKGQLELQDYNEMNDVTSKNDESAGKLSEIFQEAEIKASLEKTAKDINQALDLIEKGGYGICKYCKQDIPLKRLQVRPVSTSCVKCKSQFTN